MKWISEVNIAFMLIISDASTNPLKWILIDFSLTVKAATLIFISGRGSAISSAKQGKSGSTRVIQ